MYKLLVFTNPEFINSKPYVKDLIDLKSKNLEDAVLEAESLLLPDSKRLGKFSDFPCLSSDYDNVGYREMNFHIIRIEKTLNNLDYYYKKSKEIRKQLEADRKKKLEREEYFRLKEKFENGEI